MRIFGKGSVSSSPIVRIFGKGKCKFIANFSATMVTSLPSLYLSLSLSLSLSHRKYLTHNIGSASALPIIRSGTIDPDNVFTRRRCPIVSVYRLQKFPLFLSSSYRLQKFADTDRLRVNRRPIRKDFFPDRYDFVPIVFISSSCKRGLSKEGKILLCKQCLHIFVVLFCVTAVVSMPHLANFSPCDPQFFCFSPTLYTHSLLKNKFFRMFMGNY